MKRGYAQGGNLHDSGIDLLKVGIPKLSADTRIEQPHSRIAHTFKPKPPGKLLCHDVGKASAT